MDAISEGLSIYHISENMCIDCGACVGECPFEAIVAGGANSYVNQKISKKKNRLQSGTSAISCKEHEQRKETTMKYQLSKEHFRKLLDDMGLTHRIDDDGDFVLSMEKDDDCRYDVLVFFEVKETKISSQAYAVGMEIGADKIGDALMFCNDWNLGHAAPKASCDVKNKRFSAQCVTWTDVELSDEYLKENAIKTGVQFSWAFYKEAAKQF